MCLHLGLGFCGSHRSSKSCEDLIDIRRSHNERRQKAQHAVESTACLQNEAEAQGLTLDAPGHLGASRRRKLTGYPVLPIHDFNANHQPLAAHIVRRPVAVLTSFNAASTASAPEGAQNRILAHDAKLPSRLASNSCMSSCLIGVVRSKVCQG